MPPSDGCSPPEAFRFAPSLPLRFACGPLPLTCPRVGTGPGGDSRPHLRHAVASERRGHPRPRGGGRVRRRQVPRQRDAGNGGRGRSERSERSPLRGKLLPLRSSAYKKRRGRPSRPLCLCMSGGLLLVRSVVVTRLSLRSLVRVEARTALRACLAGH